MQPRTGGAGELLGSLADRALQRMDSASNRPVRQAAAIAVVVALFGCSSNSASGSRPDGGGGQAEGGPDGSAGAEAGGVVGGSGGSSGGAGASAGGASGAAGSAGAGGSGPIFYVAADGKDSNPGTRQDPWAHAPGMGGCTANCALHTPSPGDRFVLRGGDTWHKADFYWWHWTWSGTAKSRIYIGVDRSWFSGSAWARPVLNGDNRDYSTSPAFVSFDANYVIFDDIEFSGLYQGGQCGWGQCQYLNYGSESTYITAEHCYFHGWSHAPAPMANDNIVIAEGDSHSPTQNVGCVFAYNVVDGGDSTNGGDSGAALFHGPPIIYGNYITDVTNGLETQGTDVHDNTIGPVNPSFDSGQHENGVEQLGSAPSGGEFYYNNVLYRTTAVNFWSIPNSSVTQYDFNNVFYDTNPANIFNLCGHSGRCGTIDVFNNTIECGPDAAPGSVCIGNYSAGGSFALDANNNHLITSGSGYSCLGATTCNTGPNDVVQTKAQANGQGYTVSDLFAPASGSGSTIGTGANLTDVYCTKMIAAAPGFGDAARARAACHKDTSLGVGYDRVHHTVIVFARAPIARPATGPWNVGAYQ